MPCTNSHWSWEGLWTPDPPASTSGLGLQVSATMPSLCSTGIKPTALCMLRQVLYHLTFKPLMCVCVCVCSCACTSMHSWPESWNLKCFLLLISILHFESLTKPASRIHLSSFSDLWRMPPQSLSHPSPQPIMELKRHATTPECLVLFCEKNHFIYWAISSAPTSFLCLLKADMFNQEVNCITQLETETNQLWAAE